MLLPAEMVNVLSKMILKLRKNKRKWFAKLEFKHCIFLKFPIAHFSLVKKECSSGEGLSRKAVYSKYDTGKKQSA